MRHSRHELELRHPRLLHALRRRHLLAKDARRPLQRRRLADEQSQVDVHRRVHRRSAEREVAELDRAQFPERVGEPEVACLESGRTKRHPCQSKMG